MELWSGLLCFASFPIYVLLVMQERYHLQRNLPTEMRMFLAMNNADKYFITVLLDHDVLQANSKLNSTKLILPLVKESQILKKYAPLHPVT